MNQLPDHKIIDNILKRIYESNRLAIDKTSNYAKHPDGYYTQLNSYASVDIVPKHITSVVTITPINKLDETKNKLDLELIQTLHNLVDMYKESANPCILNEIELVLEEYIDSLYDRFE